MKKYILDFIRRGLIASSFGPLVLAIFYMIMQQQGHLQTLSVSEVCLGIVSLSALAFIAGGMNVIHQIEQLPFMLAIFIHGIVLYISYLITYLLNGWIELGITPILVFSVIFILGYVIIWVFIYSITKRRTQRINEILKQKQQNSKI